LQHVGETDIKMIRTK